MLRVPAVLSSLADRDAAAALWSAAALSSAAAVQTLAEEAPELLRVLANADSSTAIAVLLSAVRRGNTTAEAVLKDVWPALRQSGAEDLTSPAVVEAACHSGCVCIVDAVASADPASVGHWLRTAVALGRFDVAAALLRLPLPPEPFGDDDAAESAPFDVAELPTPARAAARDGSGSDDDDAAVLFGADDSSEGADWVPANLLAVAAAPRSGLLSLLPAVARRRLNELAPQLGCGGDGLASALFDALTSGSSRAALPHWHKLYLRGLRFLAATHGPTGVLVLVRWLRLSGAVTAVVPVVSRVYSEQPRRATFAPVPYLEIVLSAADAGRLGAAVAAGDGGAECQRLALQALSGTGRPLASCSVVVVVQPKHGGVGYDLSYVAMVLPTGQLRLHPVARSVAVGCGEWPAALVEPYAGSVFCTAEWDLPADATVRLGRRRLAPVAAAVRRPAAASSPPVVVVLPGLESFTPPPADIAASPPRSSRRAANASLSLSVHGSDVPDSILSPRSSATAMPASPISAASGRYKHRSLRVAPTGRRGRRPLVLRSEW
eukprot:TRINITY_DN22275_c1_g1_i1.p1 TRINITY_DN22275_c1_g1~~TRINITY_DN22275_c1_g1_i1.p1  ORF type:complete len:549 (+),score=178.87 TRINITY_DN22275_c1_g1_i1:597-2243(+)